MENKVKVFFDNITHFSSDIDVFIIFLGNIFTILLLY